MLALQRLIPALPPRLLTGVIRLLGRKRLVDPIFDWYLGLLPVEPARRTAPAAGRRRTAIV